MTDNFMTSFMSEFQDTLKKEAEESLKEYVKKYKEQLDNIETTNDELMKKAINDYHNQRKDHANKMNKMIEDKMAKAKQEFESKLQKIDDELFKDPNNLYQKIVAAADTLKKKQQAFEQEKRKWNKDDKRIAEYLEIAVEETKSTEDDEKEADAALKKNAEVISDSDHIVIKIDDRTFTPTRGTLTQVKGSFIAKLFGAHHDMMYRDEQGAYYLNCNPDTFAKVLDVLRNKGSVGSDFKMTHALYTMLLQFGILNKFFPNFDASTLGAGGYEQSNAEYHVVFKSYRSTANWSTNYPRWSKEILSSAESKEEDGKYWNVNPSNDAEIIFNKTGWYRITFRGCVYYSSHQYAQMQINGSVVAQSYIYGQSSNNYKSHNFNEILNISATQKLRFCLSNQPYVEEKSSYLCIERIPDKVIAEIAIYKSTATNSYYRQWNNTIKAVAARYSLGNSNKNVTAQKGGLYRVTARCHNNSSAQQLMSLYEYRNGGVNYYYSERGAAPSGYQCHNWDEIVNLKKDDYVQIYDNNKGTVNDKNYQCLQIEYIPHTNSIGLWKSNSVVSSYQRKWDYEYWCNESLYKLDANKSQVEILEPGNYRISSHVTQSTSSNQAGYSALYLNNSQYCLARFGAYSTTYRQTTSIQEILKLKKGDKIYIYVYPTPYNSKDYNSLFIQKLF